MNRLPSIRCLRRAIPAAIALWAMCAGIGLSLADQLETPDAAIVHANLGMEGVYLVRYQGPRLETIPVDEKDPLAVRIVDVTADGDDDLYELRFIGQYPGQHDLRDYLQRVDRQPLGEMQALTVSIDSLLPEDHLGDLEQIRESPLLRAWRYRWIVAAIGCLWLVPIVFFVVSRVFRRRPERRVMVDDETTADRLQPLVERALAGKLSGEEKASLERMLIGHWRDRLALHDCSTVESLRRMRADQMAGQLLRRLEQWLHQRPPITGVDLDEILAPYRQGAEA